MRRRMVVAFVLLGLIGPWPAATPARSATPGGVFVTGHDPDFHTLSGNTTGAKNIIRRAVEYVTFNAASPSMLLVTSRMTVPSGHLDSAAGVAAAGFTFDMAGAPGQGILDVGAVDFSLYDVVVVASDFGGILRQAELDLLNSRAVDLLDYVNGGGGLIAFSESNLGTGLTPGGGHFDFLPFLASEQAANQTEANYTLTALGVSMGLTTSDVNGNFSHSFFTAAGGMDVVNFDATGRIMSLGIRGVFVCPAGVPTASIDDVSMAEGDVGQTAFTFTVTLDAEPCGDDVTIDFATADGTASSASDYDANAGTLIFAPGVTEQNVIVQVNGDVDFEADETFTVDLSSAVNATIADAQATGTILNDDPENLPPDCASVTAAPGTLWPPNHKFVTVALGGATDPDGDLVSLAVTSVTQDEPLVGAGSGNFSPDAAAALSPGAVQLRSERSGQGDGRVYRIGFSGDDGNGGTCTGVATVGVPHDKRGAAPVDSGLVVNSFGS